jgi:hypothetical protein
MFNMIKPLFPNPVLRPGLAMACSIVTGCELNAIVLNLSLFIKAQARNQEH